MSKCPNCGDSEGWTGTMTETRTDHGVWGGGMTEAPQVESTSHSRYVECVECGYELPRGQAEGTTSPESGEE